MQAQKGFTLIETLLACLLLGLLLSFAIPGFQTAVRRSHRAEAMALLMDLHLQQAQWRAGHPAYADDLSLLRLPAQHPALRHYEPRLSNASATRYHLQLQARDGGGMQHDQINGSDCSSLSIDASGLRSPAGCWQ